MWGFRVWGVFSVPLHTPAAFGGTETHAHDTTWDHSLFSCLLDRGIISWVLQFWRCWIKGYSTASQMHFKHLSDRFSARCTWSVSFVSGKRRPGCTRLYGSSSLWAGSYYQNIWTEKMNTFLKENICIWRFQDLD